MGSDSCTETSVRDGTDGLFRNAGKEIAIRLYRNVGNKWDPKGCTETSVINGAEKLYRTVGKERNRSVVQKCQ
jgi:hypothetical protein